MSFRNRPVLDRRHRPRWQDELRTQQLTIVAFAVAIALALGIFGAAAWSGYWESHFRPVASVAGVTFDRSEVADRERIIAAETFADVAELQAQLGSPRDELLNQQINARGSVLSNLPAAATASLVDAAVLQAQADAFGVNVTEEELDAGLAERYTLPERIAARLILVEALAEDAEPDDEPTEEQLEAARDEAQEALDRIQGGDDFGTVASEVSDDFTASAGGILGWFEADDVAYAEYFTALADAERGDVVGPIETERGFAVLQLDARREATTEGGVRTFLAEEGIAESEYREYLRGELLVEEFRKHFEDEVATSPAAQRRVAQIVIAPPAGAVVPEERARHVLVAPDPDAEDQTEATDEQWAAALEEAREVREALDAPDADWFAIADEFSDEPGAGDRGGDLGWFDPATVSFVPEFIDALAELEVGELSQPIRTDFGYHLIQKTGARESPEAQAAELVADLREAPDTFGEVARTMSEDYETAQEDGELGWVAPYQLGPEVEEAIFALDEAEEIGDPVELEDGAIVIYRLLETSESRPIEPERLEQIHASGFDRWLDDEVRAPVRTWIDPQFESSAA